MNSFRQFLIVFGKPCSTLSGLTYLGRFLSLTAAAFLPAIRSTPGIDLQYRLRGRRAMVCVCRSFPLNAKGHLGQVLHTLGLASIGARRWKAIKSKHLPHRIAKMAPYSTSGLNYQILLHNLAFCVTLAAALYMAARKSPRGFMILGEKKC